MKILPQNAEMIVQGPGKDGLLKHIETAARTCYQSGSLAKEGSAERMVDALIRNQHTAMLEHGTIYFKMPEEEYLLMPMAVSILIEKWGSCVLKDEVCYGSIDYRTYMSNEDLRDCIRKFECEPEKHHERRITIRMTTNLQVATDFLRHRRMSFAMETTRYCAYDKERFGNELSFISPVWLDGRDIHDAGLREWANAMQDAEIHYMNMRKLGWPQEQCSQALPKATKTTLVMTGYESFWDHFFDLRYYEKTGNVHPQVKEIATMVYNLIKTDR